MTPDSPRSPDKKDRRSPGIAPTRARPARPGRVFTTTHGASEDLLNDGFRRMLVNACLWARGARDAHHGRPSDIAFVGPYQPSTFDFGGFVKGVKPSDLAGWDSPIPPIMNEAGTDERRRRHALYRHSHGSPMPTGVRRAVALRRRLRRHGARRRSRSSRRITSASSATRWPSGCSTTAGSRRCCTRASRSTSS